MLNTNSLQFYHFPRQNPSLHILCQDDTGYNFFLLIHRKKYGSQQRSDSSFGLTYSRPDLKECEYDHRCQISETNTFITPLTTRTQLSPTCCKCTHQSDAASLYELDCPSMHVQYTPGRLNLFLKSLILQRQSRNDSKQKKSPRRQANTN